MPHEDKHIFIKNGIAIRYYKGTWIVSSKEYGVARRQRFIEYQAQIIANFPLSYLMHQSYLIQFINFVLFNASTLSHLMDQIAFQM